MKKSRFTETQIVKILKEADAGLAAEDLSRQHGFSMYPSLFMRVAGGMHTRSFEHVLTWVSNISKKV